MHQNTLRTGSRWLALLFVGLAVWLPAQAQNPMATGTLNLADQFARPDNGAAFNTVSVDNNCNLGPIVGTNDFGSNLFGFAVLPMFTTVTEALEILDTSSPSVDSFFAVYRDSFDPMNPLTNLCAANDDRNGLFGIGTAESFAAGFAQGNNLVLEANRQYFLVISSFFTNETGSVTATINAARSPNTQFGVFGGPELNEVAPDPTTGALGVQVSFRNNFGGTVPDPSVTVTVNAPQPPQFQLPPACSQTTANTLICNFPALNDGQSAAETFFLAPQQAGNYKLDGVANGTGVVARAPATLNLAVFPDVRTATINFLNQPLGENRTNPVQVTLVNNGNFAATGIQTVIDFAGMGVNLAPQTAGCAVTGGAQVTCNTGQLAVGAQQGLTVNVTPSGGGNLMGATTVTLNEPDANPGNNNGMNVVNVVAAGAQNTILTPELTNISPTVPIVFPMSAGTLFQNEFYNATFTATVSPGATFGATNARVTIADVTARAGGLFSTPLYGNLQVPASCGPFGGVPNMLVCNLGDIPIGGSASFWELPMACF